MSAIDTIMLENGLNDSIDESNVEQKYYLDIVDNQGGVFQNDTVELSTENLRTTSNLVSWPESSFQFPLKITLLYAMSMNATIPLAVKNSILDFLYSYEIKMNGEAIIDRTNLSNILNNWKLVALNTPNDEFTRDELLYSKNDCTVFYSNAESVSGMGECNNRVGLRKTTLPTRIETLDVDDTANKNINKGYIKRANLMSEIPDVYMDKNKYGQIRKSYLDISGDKKTYTYNMWINIPLRYISDFFQKAPLMRGAFLECNFDMNMVQSLVVPHTHKIETATNVAFEKFKKPTSSITSKNFNPFQLGSDLAQKVTPAITDATGTISISSEIGGAFGTKCYLHLCMYKLNPLYESTYFSNNSPAKIYYETVRMQTFYKTTNNVNIQIATNARKLKYVLIQTLVHQGKNANDTALNHATITNGNSTLLSPFTSSNSTKGQYYNAQILVGGTDYYKKAINYDYEFYTEQYNNIQINGGISRQFGSTNLSKEDYMKNGYGFMLFDLSRLKSQTEWSMSQSLEFTATFLGNHAEIDLNVFYVSENDITLDLQTSNKVE